MLMTDPARADATLHAPEPDRLTLSVDDFGTGYCRWPTSSACRSIVIQDRQVVRDGDGGRRVRRGDRALGRSTSPTTLGLRVVAEGVESEDAWRHLEALGCDFAQGYFLSRPLPAEPARG
jgi:EAL domain-containing protein (putative c-di-GMP-specific phosphodiesterase class I)